MPRKTLPVGDRIPGRACASMRPRPDAAENNFAGRSTRAGGVRRFNEAAARCRGKRGGEGETRTTAGASMRPRPDAAENTGGRNSTPTRPSRFNEAAARCRGKPGANRRSSTTSTGFNEAAARCRGKPGIVRPPRSAAGGFNEAAARCRGKRRPEVPHGEAPPASMRPRPDAAENPDDGAEVFIDVALQ